MADERKKETLADRSIAEVIHDAPDPDEDDLDDLDGMSQHHTLHQQRTC